MLTVSLNTPSKGMLKTQKNSCCAAGCSVTESHLSRFRHCALAFDVQLNSEDE